MTGLLHASGRGWLLGVGIPVLILAVASGSAGATACKTVNGKVTLTTVSGPGCTSPVGLCVSGDLSGGLSGTALSTVTSITPTADTPTTSVVLLTADTLITTKDGTLTLKDAIVTQTSGAGEFSELDTVVAGTGDWAGATGVLRVAGTFDGTTVVGSYEARVCGA